MRSIQSVNFFGLVFLSFRFVYFSFCLIWANFVIKSRDFFGRRKTVPTVILLYWDGDRGGKKHTHMNAHSNEWIVVHLVLVGKKNIRRISNVRKLSMYISIWSVSDQRKAHENPARKTQCQALIRSGKRNYKKRQTNNTQNHRNNFNISKCRWTTDKKTHWFQINELNGKEREFTPNNEMKKGKKARTNHRLIRNG